MPQCMAEVLLHSTTELALDLLALVAVGRGASRYRIAYPRRRLRARTGST